MGTWIFFTIVCIGLAAYAIFFLKDDKSDKHNHTSS